MLKYTKKLSSFARWKLLSAQQVVAMVSIALTTVFMIYFMVVESETGTAALLILAVVSAYLANKFGIFEQIKMAYVDNERIVNMAIVVGVLVLTFFLREDHFPLLMIATVLIYFAACCGINVQLGYAGMINFSGAAFFGVGCYTAAVLTKQTGIPHALILLIGGFMAALVSGLLILPVLRTKGHYSAVVTIAFAILFKTFLEVNDTLGGPQGLKVDGFTLFGWNFNNNIEIGDGTELSFYVAYVLISLLIAICAYTLVRRIERSWVGLNLDVVRTDETSAACFGLNIVRWKITAFSIGNFMTGVAGALYGMMLGYIAPSSFTFADSLIMLSIVLLGGTGSIWGVAFSATIVVVIPEKLQVIQEYRFLIYATLVMLILMFRAEGILPRGVRRFFPGVTR